MVTNRKCVIKTVEKLIKGYKMILTESRTVLSRKHVRGD